MTDDLIAFLRARLDGDERVARSAWPGPWTATPNGEGASELHGPQILSSSPPPVLAEDADAQHIARWDPARALVEVDARRRIIAQYEAICEQVSNPVSAANFERAYAMKGELRDVLELIALPYADHPDYREEWRPATG